MDLLNCPFCGAPAEEDEGDARCSVPCEGGKWWIKDKAWNARSPTHSEKDAFEQFVVSLAESERKLKIANAKLAAIEEQVSKSVQTIESCGYAIAAINKILGEINDN